MTVAKIYPNNDSACPVCKGPTVLTELTCRHKKALTFVLSCKNHKYCYECSSSSVSTLASALSATYSAMNTPPRMQTGFPTCPRCGKQFIEVTHDSNNYDFKCPECNLWKMAPTYAELELQLEEIDADCKDYDKSMGRANNIRVQNVVKENEERFNNMPTNSTELSDEEKEKLLKEMKETGKGIKFDQEKLKYSLLPWDAVKEVVKVLMIGARKYSASNWVVVPGASGGTGRYANAAMRHLVSYMSGEKNDPETKLSHLAHCACCILFLLAYDLRGIVSKPEESK